MDNKKLNVLLALLIVTSTVLLVWLVFTGGVSEIHVAAAQGDLARVESILAEKPELVNARDKDGWIPLHMAANAGHNRMVELLLANGAEVSAKTFKKSRWGYSNKEFGWTALHMAVNAGNKEMAKLLLVNGAEVNVKTNIGHTPLHMACIEGHKEMVVLLLANGAEVNAKTDDGHTPLKYSVVMGRDGVAEFLRKHDGVE
jgi:ankyrin repeat protein